MSHRPNELQFNVPILGGQRIDADRMRFYEDYGSYEPWLLSTSTDPNVGSDGVRNGAWIRQGKWISGWARFVFGTVGVSFGGGGGTYLVTLPWPIDPSFVNYSGTSGQGHMIGWGYIRDNTTAADQGVTLQPTLDSGIYAGWMSLNSSNSTVNPTTPFTWASADGIAVCFSYPTIV